MSKGNYDLCCLSPAGVFFLPGSKRLFVLVFLKKKRPNQCVSEWASQKQQTGRLCCCCKRNAATQQCKCGILTCGWNTIWVYRGMIIALVVNTRSLMKREQGLGGTCSRALKQTVNCLEIIGQLSLLRCVSETAECLGHCKTYSVVFLSPRILLR